MLTGPEAKAARSLGALPVPRINPGSEPPVALRALIDRSPLRSLAAGEVLAHPGECQQRVGWLLAGRLRSVSLGADGSEFTHDLIGPAEWAFGGLQFGSESCCVEPGLGVVAVMPSAVRLVDLKALQALRATDGESADYLFSRVLQASARRLQRESELVHLSAAERYQSLLQRQPGIEAELSQKQIAHFLGITPVALSRIRRREREAEQTRGG
jgi:CRP-like cAMP-binding protein